MTAGASSNRKSHRGIRRLLIGAAAGVVGLVALGLGLLNVSGAGHALIEKPPPEVLATLPSPPGQPEEGPGSAVYPHAEADVKLHWAGSRSYWVYAPAKPAPQAAPVVVYQRGYAVPVKEAYEALFLHLARKGYLVVVPEYAPIYNLPDYPDHAFETIAAALDMLQSWSGPRPNGRFAMLGHSLGGLLTLVVASQAKPRGLPEPELIVLHEPAGVAYLDYELEPDDLSTLPASTRLLVIQAETSVEHVNSFAVGAFQNTVSIPREHKNLLVVHSDDRGWPVLLSDHGSIHSGVIGHPLDATDYWGYFRPTEAALAEVLGDTPPPYSVFCNTPGPECDPVRNAGTWSDGHPVRPIENAGDRGL